MLTEAMWVALATVSIQVPKNAEDAAREHVVASCDSVLGEGECVASDGGEAATWLAVVSWEGHHLTITLSAHRADAPFVARTELDFSPQDSDEQRWVATGLMVAALTAAQPKVVAPSPPPPKPSPPPEPVPVLPPPLPERTRGYHLWGSLGGFTGPGLDSGPLRWGGEGRVKWRPQRIPLGVTGAGRLAFREGTPSLAWYDAGLGVFGSTPRSAPVSLLLGGEMVLQSAQARATRNGRHEVARSLRLGGRGWAALSVHLGPRLAWWASGSATVLRPELEIRLDSQKVGEESWARWSIGSGLEFELLGPRP